MKQKLRNMNETLFQKFSNFTKKFLAELIMSNGALIPYGEITKRCCRKIPRKLNNPLRDFATGEIGGNNMKAI